MTREEFMKHAEKEIDQAFRGQKNRMMNLVEQAWAEGKRNAETDQVKEIGNELIESLKKSLMPPLSYRTQDGWTVSTSADSYIPENCKNCSNHPSNGGSGICHCILGEIKTN